MFESTLENVIAIDTDGEAVHFFSAENGAQKSFRHDTYSYRANPFSEEFFEKLGGIFKLHAEKNPGAQLQKVSLVLPDQAFFTDTINIPTIQKSAMNTSLGLAVQNVYKNVDELEYKTSAMVQNKQLTTYGLVGVRKELITKLKKVCSEHQISIANVTFAANSAVDGAFVINPKLKNSSFMLLDIKEKSARFAMVVKGRTAGFYSLPFGYTILSRSRLTAEDLLFDHSAAELLVLNAKEKARAKQLTVGDEIAAMDSPDYEAEFMSEDAEDSFDSDGDLEPRYVHSSSKKAARKLPKFMLRDTPSGKEAYVYENFRIFMKWTLDFCTGNSSLVNLGAIDTVYVNMPEDISFLFAKLKEEEEESGFKFAPLTEARNQEKVLENLELFGGFYVKQYNKTNNF